MKQELSTNPPEKFLKRRELALRWKCSGQTLKRRQEAGMLHPLYLSKRKILFRLSEIEAIENAGGAQ